MNFDRSNGTGYPSAFKTRNGSRAATVVGTAAARDVFRGEAPPWFRIPSIEQLSTADEFVVPGAWSNFNRRQHSSKPQATRCGGKKRRLAPSAYAAIPIVPMVEDPMLQLRPNCECCERDLPPDSVMAVICSFECTFCRDCALGKLKAKCPNCGGELVARPRRPADKLTKNPASTERVFKPAGCAAA